MSGASDLNFGPSAAEDYTEEEKVMLQDVETANEEQKRALYEKYQQESEMKR